MKMHDYLLTLDGVYCIVYVREMSAPPRGDNEGSWCLEGFLKVEEDFIKVSSSGDFELPTIVQIKDILVVDVVGDDDDDDVEDEIEIIEDDIYTQFEKMWKERKG